MRLVFISDTHGYLRERDIPSGDVLIHCGDACSSGQIFEFERFCEQMHGLSKQFKQVLYTPGNHDRCVEAMTGACRAMFDTDNARMLLHEPFEFEGVKFFGSPYTPAFMNWAFMYKRSEGVEKWASIPDDTDVLFTHGMPYGVLDRVGRDIGEDKDARVGCEALTVRIAEIEPAIFAGGHLHLEGGQHIQKGRTTFVNAAICDDSYSPTRVPFCIELETNPAYLMSQRPATKGTLLDTWPYDDTTAK